MSVYESNAQRRSVFPKSPRHPGRHVACSVFAGILGLALLGSCSNSSTPSDDGGPPGSSGGSSGGSNGGNSSGVSGSNGGSNGGSSSGGSNGGSNGSSGGSGGSGSGASSSGSGGGSSSGPRDGGPDSTLPPGDGGGGQVCTNTDMTKINIDSSGWACNNQWGITGAWYCFADTTGTSSCPGGTAGTGVIPFVTASNAMCVSGTTVPGASAYGAGIGVELNHPVRDAGAKSPFDAPSKQIVGFAITITGDSGGSALNINLPPAVTTTGESPAITVPGVSSGSSPITYNVLIADAVVSDNTSAPIPKVAVPNAITDVQVAIPADGISHTYNYCITKIVPIMAAPTAPGALGNYGPAFTEAKQIVLTGIGPYGIQNDPFTVGSQMAMQAQFGGGQAGFSATPTFNTAGTNTPGAFPSIAYGWVHGGNFVGAGGGGYAGGKTIGGGTGLTSVPTSWSFTAPGGGSWDAAYDVWFGGNPNSINPGFELMVWLARSTVNPIGGAGTPVTIGGRAFTVSTGTNGTGQPVVSYVSTTNLTTTPAGFNLLPFFQDAATNGRAGLSNASFLLGVQAGFELYNPGTWTTNSYSISIQ